MSAATPAQGSGVRHSLPSRYGPDDTLGAANEITPARVEAAARLIRRGVTYQMGQVLDSSAPAQMWRYWKQSLLVDRAVPGRFLGSNEQSFVEESVAGALHSGTHMDGLGHIGIGSLAYNGNAYPDIITSEGLTKLGIESVPPIFTRGVLLDIPRALGRTELDPEYAISADDLLAAMTAQGIEASAGDVVFVHTGWGSLWGKDNARYAMTEPGIGLSAAAILTDRRVTMIGADNWAVEVVPADPGDILFPVHQHCITKFGCYLLENARTEELAKDQVWEFCCVILPNRLKGASASMVSPLGLI
jgi:kynurenine formamidase